MEIQRSQDAEILLCTVNKYNFLQCRKLFGHKNYHQLLNVIRLATDDYLYGQNVFYKEENYFFLLFINDGEIISYFSM